MSRFDNNRVHDSEVHNPGDLIHNEQKLPSFHYPDKDPSKNGK